MASHYFKMRNRSNNEYVRPPALSKRHEELRNEYVSLCMRISDLLRACAPVPLPLHNKYISVLYQLRKVLKEHGVYA